VYYCYVAITMVCFKMQPLQHCPYMTHDTDSLPFCVCGSRSAESSE